MAKKTGLGKGLDALFSDKPLTQAEEEKILKVNYLRGRQKEVAVSGRN